MTIKLFQQLPQRRPDVRSISLTLLLLMFLPVMASAQSIVSVVPNSASPGANVQVQITGSNTVFLQDSEVTSIVWLSQFDTRIDASNVDVTSATLLDATFDIPADAATGLWDVNVQQVGGGSVVSLVGGFTIVGAPPCSISDLAAGTQTACNPATNTDTKSMTVTYTNSASSWNVVCKTKTITIG